MNYDRISQGSRHSKTSQKGKKNIEIFLLFVLEFVFEISSQDLLFVLLCLKLWEETYLGVAHGYEWECRLG